MPETRFIVRVKRRLKISKRASQGKVAVTPVYVSLLGEYSLVCVMVQSRLACVL